ncbi:MAG: excinuclease ABC subunit C [Candidatus Parabeggiatoa sp. nov. 3]|nr:MAG: excinuclease ABC subunit C [Gammaproteobacteria bacterium]RKZ59722.1 MAG: excinuclease ABC subunit C [Gammaproteobacteria bacterium]RKZ78202.1 MAG: excinuclease ABC subunit C [Gammaproteobacteria bacterium]
MTDSTVTFDSKTFLANLTNKPGVYCMLDATGTVLYVGKARHLKKRVASYFNQSANMSPKTRALVTQIANIEVTVTQTETEALILENTLIKRQQPRYNILLRDDKSYPYICLSHHPFPRLTLHRGVRKVLGRCFGPYPHVRAVHETINLLQKLFRIRQCDEHFFNYRSRPCLQYQIQRCTAPCVGLIDAASYQEDVQHAMLFLEGKSQTVLATLIEKMEEAAKALAFETAAKYRDQIRALIKIQTHQYVSIEGDNIDIDIIAAVIGSDMACVQVLMVREGRQVGNRAFQIPSGPKIPQGFEIPGPEIETLLAAFLPQYYLAANRDIPDEIVLQCEIDEIPLLTEVISQQRGRQVLIHSKVRATRAQWLKMALENAQVSLVQRQPYQYTERLATLSIVLSMETLPLRMECFDVSHTQGEATVAACVVFDLEGPNRSDYRRFNIDNITGGDDYAAMREALMRRYSRLQKEAAPLPELLFIDGGIGQFKVAQTVLNQLQLTDIRIIGVAKGPNRQAGFESLILSEEGPPLRLPKDSLALLLIQQIRDEAHRFAITAHRGRQAKIQRTSVLEEIRGIGLRRRQDLLNYFGGLQGISQASVEDLAAVPGIEKLLAKKIYDFFHKEE